ncbi:MAG TPA: hypothetical protein DCL44_11380 [Elusimicrobia bacterium]|nr:hypothetical protein [Elusimicrobiota bacterium]
MRYKKSLDAENDFKQEFSSVRKRQYNEVWEFIEKEGKEKFTLDVWERMYKKYKNLYIKTNKSFVDNMHKT